MIEAKILKQYYVDIVSRTEKIQEHFIAITTERLIKLPPRMHIRDTVSSNLFTVNTPVCNCKVLSAIPGFLWISTGIYIDAAFTLTDYNHI